MLAAQECIFQASDITSAIEIHTSLITQPYQFVLVHIDNRELKLSSVEGTGVTISLNGLLKLLNKLQSIHHENISRFVGIILDPSDKYILSENSGTENLYEFLKKTQIVLTKDFKLSLLWDIADGVRFLHSSSLVHGKLSSKCIFLNAKWQIKISDYWINLLSTSPNIKYHYDISNTDSELLLWTAPEILHGSDPTQHSDVFSFAIILYEVLVVDKPYATNIPSLNNCDIVHMVATSENETPYRPFIDDAYDTSLWNELSERCWNDNPDLRGNFTEVMHTLMKINNYHEISLADSLLSRMEELTIQLENLVDVRSAELALEKDKAEHLLFELLPQTVCEKIKQGGVVEPELFDEVTISFSDIVGFTRITSLATPMQTVTLLNELFYLMDNVLSRHDVCMGGNHEKIVSLYKNMILAKMLILLK